MNTIPGSFPWELRTEYCPSIEEESMPPVYSTRSPKERLPFFGGRCWPLLGLPAERARLLPNSTRLHPSFQDTDSGWQRIKQFGRSCRTICGFIFLSLNGNGMDLCMF